MSRQGGSDGSAQLDEQLRGFVEKTRSAYASLSPRGPVGLDERRRVAERVRAPWTRGGPEMTSTVSIRAGELNVPVRIYRPGEAANLPALVYLHGGGWTLFSLDTHDRLMREYAARAGVAVLGVVPQPASASESASSSVRMRSFIIVRTSLLRENLLPS